jgi:hypothetical protein
MGQQPLPFGTSASSCCSQKYEQVCTFALSSLEAECSFHAFIIGTDVGAEMANVSDELSSCRICLKACNAAVEMLAVSHSARLT